MDNDYELVYLAQGHDEDALVILYNKYESVIKARANYFYSKSNKRDVDLNDFYQEAFIGFNEAVKRYNQDANAIFYTYVMNVLDKRLSSYLRKGNTFKDKAFVSSMYLDENLVNIGSSSFNPEKYAVDLERRLEVLNKFKSILSDKENEVIYLKMVGYSINEIACKLDSSVKTVYNTLYRARDKIKKDLMV